MSYYDSYFTIISKVQIKEIALNTINCPDSLNLEFFDFDKCNLRLIFCNYKIKINILIN